MKYDRNRSIFFGSWTAQDIEESASVDIGDSKGVTGCKVVPATFGKKVNNLSGEYVFNHDGENWLLGSSTIAAESLTTDYGLTVEGEAAENDILVVTYSSKRSGWEALGKDNDDLTKELNPDTESSKNVLGETTFVHSGYEPEIAADPYYIDPSRKMYAHLRDVAMEERYGDADILGYLAEAFFTAANTRTRTMSGYALVRQAYFVPQSTGGDTTGYAIPVNINPIGSPVKKKIVYDMATNEATITDFDAE